MSEETTEIKLRGKQKLFAEEYVICLNGTLAAERAGYDAVNRRTLASIASENLRKPDIRAYIDKLLSEKAMSREEILGRLAAQARGDIGDLLDATGNLDLRVARESGMSHLIKEIELTTTIYEDKEVHTSKVKIHDPQAALVHLGRALAMFTDKTELSTQDGKPLPLAIVKMDMDAI